MVGFQANDFFLPSNTLPTFKADTHKKGWTEDFNIRLKSESPPNDFSPIRSLLANYVVPNYQEDIWLTSNSVKNPQSQNLLYLKIFCMDRPVLHYRFD